MYVVRQGACLAEEVRSYPGLSMDSWLTALIAVGGALAGSALTGYIAFKIARDDQDAREKVELREALVVYGAILDRLSLQIAQLPRAAGVKEGWMNRLIARWPELDWVMGRLSTATLGRGVMRTIDELLTATNRLILIAPHSVLAASEEINRLLENLRPGSAEWKREWQEGREGLVKASREALDS
jgi:hypothetical protein